MSRGRGAGAGRGRGTGRGIVATLPAGITFEDVITANKTRDPTPLYPSFPDLPVLTHITDRERQICKYQMGFADRLKKSAYYLVDGGKDNKINQVPRFSDKYNIVLKKRPKLDPSVLEPSLFPKAIWEEYFETGKSSKHPKAIQSRNKKAKLNLDALEATEGVEGDEDEIKRKEGEEEEVQPDYDDDEEEFGDDDYVDNYFSGGEGEGDDAFDAGGEDNGGGD